MRVLSIPGRTYIGNPYWKHFCEAFDATGVEVVEVRSLDAATLRFDVLHIHFPDHKVAEHPLPKAILLSAVFLGFLAAVRLFGRKVVWTVHDVTPFKKRHAWLLRLHMRCVRALTSGYVFMNPSSRADYLAAYPREGAKPSRLIGHGVFPTIRVSAERRGQLRSELSGGEDAFLVGFLGDIKPYKNIGALRLVPERDGAGRPIRIVVAGRIDRATDAGEVARALSAAGPERVHRIDRRLDDRELAELMGSVDVVFLPYRLGSNSGFAVLVLAAGGRLVTSDLPMFLDLEAEFGAPWVVCAAEEPQAMAAAFRAAAARAVAPQDIESRERGLALVGFEAGALELAAFYRDLGVSDRPVGNAASRADGTRRHPDAPPGGPA